MNCSQRHNRIFLGDYRLAAVVLLLGLALASAMLAGCSNDGPVDTETLTGVVVAVEQKSLIEVEWVEVQDGQEQVRRFHASGALSHFTPSHLREHSLSAQRVTVTYHEENGLYVIDDIVDAR